MHCYLDSNILAEYLYPTGGPNKGKAARIFEKCRSGEYQGVISKLVLIELAGVCQKAVVRGMSRARGASEAELENLAQRQGLERYRAAVEKLIQIPSIEFRDVFGRDAESLLAAALQIMLETRGTVKAGRRPGSGRYYFKRAYAADVLHAVLAKSTACSKFLTLDKDIAKLQGHRRLGGLEISDS